jgi:protein-tyrosine phosphatase
MAEALARDRVDDEWKDKVEFSSAGTLDLGGSPASALAVEVMSEAGIDMSSHRSTHLTGDIIRDSDLIVPMAARHSDVIISLVPEAEERVVLLGDLDPGRNKADIRDPIGGDREIYIAARDDIDSLIGPLLEYIRKRFGPED